MGYAEQWNGYVARKRQTGKGVQASGAGAILVPMAGGQGGQLSKTPIESRLVRQDGLQKRGRHGSQRTSGTYSSELIIGSADDVLEDVMRGAFSTADLTITQSVMTSITTTTNTIVATAGSWVTQGLRVGDVIRATGLPDAANNNKNLRITGLTATTITVAELLVANASADTTFSVVRVGRTLDNPLAGALQKRYVTIEEHEFDLDASELYTDCVWNRMRISMNADGLLTTEYGWIGTGQFETKDAAAAPFFTTPVDPTGGSLAALEATLRVGTSDVLDLTSFDITIERPGQTPAVTGPSKFAPDVFMGTLQVSMNLTFLRKDMLPIADFLAENQLSLSLLAQENAASPANFFSLFVPNFSLGGVSKSAMAKEGGARTTTLQVPASMVGLDERGGAFARSMVRFQVSNAS